MVRTGETGVWRERAVRAALALAPPLLFHLYARFPTLLLIPYVALVPWVLLYTDPRRGRAPWGYFIVAAWLSWFALHPASARFGWEFPVVASVVFTLPWLPFAPWIRRIHQGLTLPRVLTVPVVWVAVEYLRARFTLSHFDLFLLGYSQAPLTPLIQVADVTGVYGVSFLVAAVNGFLADAVLAWREPGGGVRALVRRRRVLAGAAAVALLWGGAWVYGLLRLSGGAYTEGPRLAVVQPNERHSPQRVVGVHLTQLFMTEDHVPEDGVDLVVWPENAILDNLFRKDAYLNDFRWLGRRKGTWFLVGAMRKPPEHPGRTHNTAFLVDPEGRVQGYYDKQLLFPWSEFVPGDAFLGRWWPGLQRLQRNLVRAGWGFLPPGLPGERMRLLELPGPEGMLPFGVLICVENVYPPIPAEAARQGARFLVNITSEGAVAGPIQEQLLRVSMFRAVENRITYVRNGNTGISCLVDPLGRLQALLRGEKGGVIHDRGVLLVTVPLRTGGPTLYARSQDAFAKLCLLAALLLYGAAWAGRRTRAAAALVCTAGLVAGSCASPPRWADDPSVAPQALEQAREWAARGDTARACESLVDACAAEGACASALPELARCFEIRRRPEDGADFFEQVRVTYPALEADARLYRGRMLELFHELEAARGEYEASLALRPSPGGYLRLALLLQRMDRYEEAAATCEQGLALDPDHVELRALSGKLLRILGRLEAAQERLQGVLVDRPDHVEAWTDLGRVLMAQGLLLEARAALERAAALDPAHVRCRYAMVRLALARDDLPEARRITDEIRAIEARRSGGH